MRIIISPAKRMNENGDTLGHCQMPHFMKETEELLAYLKALNYTELKSLWKCNDSIAEQNYRRIQTMDLYKNLTPCILSYDGIQYTYLKAEVLEDSQLEYLEEHLRILSGFYGILRPFDGVVPYRLEMQAVFKSWHTNSLYQFWKDSLSKVLLSESDCIVNLASKEYSKCILPYLKQDTTLVTCVFGEIKNEKVIEKGTYAKIARGEMVRFMAENKIRDVEDIKQFNRLNYTYEKALSDEGNYIFIRNK
ncbi:MAG TPA: peroxide stress protein YaaA [Clostridiales bacterium]|nr:peroxide stress protein YaaA [Clostridiales bacterium]